MLCVAPVVAEGKVVSSHGCAGDNLFVSRSPYDTYYAEYDGIISGKNNTQTKNHASRFSVDPLKTLRIDTPHFLLDPLVRLDH